MIVTFENYLHCQTGLVKTSRDTLFLHPLPQHLAKHVTSSKDATPHLVYRRSFEDSDVWCNIKSGKINQFFKICFFLRLLFFVFSFLIFNMLFFSVQVSLCSHFQRSINWQTIIIIIIVIIIIIIIMMMMMIIIRWRKYPAQIYCI